MSSKSNTLIQMQKNLANSIHPIEIHLHLVSGRTHIYSQNDLNLARKICDAIDGSIFNKPSIIIESDNDMNTFPGTALLGISVYSEPLPDSYLKHELGTNTTVRKISHAQYQESYGQIAEKSEGQRELVLSEVEFVNGARIYLEINEIAAFSADERSAMHHLFSHPALICRVIGGFSIWNIAHIVSWSHYPKMNVPIDSWVADSSSNFPLDDSQCSRFI